jgi:hypothetical protein
MTMMVTVWKYALTPGMTVIQMPAAAVPLTVGVQDGSLVLWALVAVQGQPETRVFLTAGTGHAFPAVSTQIPYVGTASMGSLVWHVFEVLEERA